MVKELFSVYCSCIEDTVKLIDCESCINRENGKCQYEKKSEDFNQEKIEND